MHFWCSSFLRTAFRWILLRSVRLLSGPHPLPGNSFNISWVFANFYRRFITGHRSYRPGSKNIKPDALSHLFHPISGTKSPSNIRPSSCVVGAVIWGIEETVRRVNAGIHVPDGCPLNRLFVPISLRSQVIHWARSSLVSCQTRIRRALLSSNNASGGRPWRERLGSM